MAELVESTIEERSFHSNGAVEYELVQSTRRRQVESGIDENINMNSRDRRESDEVNHKPQAVYSTESQFLSRTSQQHLLGRTSNNTELSVVEEDKESRINSSSGCTKALLLMLLFGIIVGFIALVIGALAVRNRLCDSGDVFSLSCNTRPVENDDQQLIMEQLASLKKQVQELRDLVSSNYSFSAVVNTLPIYEGCITRIRTCRAVPVTQDYLAAPSGPVCKTGRVNIEVSSLCIQACVSLSGHSL